MLNTVVLMGRLTYEPEVKVTATGTSYVNFQVAIDRRFQKAGEERKADFVDCIAWRQTADFLGKYFHKGSMIAVEGSIQTDNFTDKDGNKRKSTTVVANQVSFCGSKNESQSGDSQLFAQHAGSDSQIPPQQPAGFSNADSSDFVEIIGDDDDLPF